MKKLSGLFFLVVLITPGFLFAQKIIPPDRLGKLTYKVLLDSACNIIEYRTIENSGASRKIIKASEEAILKIVSNLREKDLCSTAPLTLSFAFKKKKYLRKQKNNGQRFLQTLPS